MSIISSKGIFIGAQSLLNFLLIFKTFNLLAFMGSAFLCCVSIGTRQTEEKVPEARRNGFRPPAEGERVVEYRFACGNRPATKHLPYVLQRARHYKPAVQRLSAVIPLA
ncbi:MAG: hypothetical protein C4K47_05305 [Candidatus Thorarchaeota archaeon]|nr:MAG: hypothetical protein C4K47_05305 [Candidatus Thorarchaeota archaeon]